MSSRLDSLSGNLARGEHKFWGFERYTEEQRELLIKKGIYPYEYMDSWDKFIYDTLHETYDHWSVAVLTVTVHSSFVPTFHFF